MTDLPSPGLTRRRLLGAGLGAAGVIVAGGYELIDHGVLPGKHVLERIDGACDVAVPAETFRKPGPTFTGQFHSVARQREVGYTLAYPPGHGRGSELPLVVYLHADGGSHSSPLGQLSLAKALAGDGLAPMALVAADGSDLYWHPHPGDDPMDMVVNELIPMCQRLGLGQTAHSLGLIGISMGGYGAIIFAEKYPHLFPASAAISPAIWTTYAQARSANPHAFSSAAEFRDYDAVTHTDTLANTAMRIATGTDDPFVPGVQTLMRHLPSTAQTQISSGCHDDSFFASQQHASLTFLADHIGY